MIMCTGFNLHAENGSLKCIGDSCSERPFYELSPCRHCTGCFLCAKSWVTFQVLTIVQGMDGD